MQASLVFKTLFNREILASRLVEYREKKQKNLFEFLEKETNTNIEMRNKINDIYLENNKKTKDEKKLKILYQQYNDAIKTWDNHSEKMNKIYELIKNDKIEEAEELTKHYFLHFSPV